MIQFKNWDLRKSSEKISEIRYREPTKRLQCWVDTVRNEHFISQMYCIPSVYNTALNSNTQINPLKNYFFILIFLYYNFLMLNFLQWSFPTNLNFKESKIHERCLQAHKTQTMWPVRSHWSCRFTVFTLPKLWLTLLLFMFS